MDAPATVKFRCTSCHQKLRVRAELIGHLVKCPRCGGSPVVPAEGLPDDGPKAHPHPPAPPVAPPPKPPGPPPLVLEPRSESPRVPPPVSAARPPAPPLPAVPPPKPPAPGEPEDLLPVLEPCSEPEDPLPVLEVLSEVEPAARPPLPNAPPPPPPPLRGG